MSRRAKVSATTTGLRQQREGVPTLIEHGDADQIVPLGTSAVASAKLVAGATPKVYPDAPHGLAETHRDQLNPDLLSFLRS
jgi:non-heme chloroperoxidase